MLRKYQQKKYQQILEKIFGRGRHHMIESHRKWIFSDSDNHQTIHYDLGSDCWITISSGYDNYVSFHAPYIHFKGSEKEYKEQAKQHQIKFFSELRTSLIESLDHIINYLETKTIEVEEETS